PVSLDILVGNLSVFGNEFVNTKIKFANPVNGWSLSLDGKDIRGNVNINNKLNIDLEHLIIHGNEEVNEEKLIVSNLPNLEIAVDKMIYKEKDFGQTLIATSKANDGINIDKLSISKEGLTIDATGKWTQTDGIDRSEFTATLKSESIDTMLQTFGYDNANIEDGQTDIKLTANWRDTPLNFSIEKINGELDMNIDKGQFLDIDPSAGRLFGLLSIQTLPRRLALDFTDIFNEGFSFDSIKGNFTLQQGHAYTNDLEMTGPSANIIVSGRTGLITEDYDQIATVTPKITNSLPVASALFGPIGIGVGAVIYLTGELFESIPKNIDKILSFQYSIKGSWDSPSIEKIDEEDSQSG
ncbi:MAG: hypothetical protein MI865_10640, partial [Proteobacteria bacterium]|nr:hypothetical protein [Pseudomonadota bacterium]